MIAARILSLLLLSISASGCLVSVPAMNRSILNNALGLEEVKTDTQTRDSLLLGILASAPSGPEINIRQSGVTYLSGGTFSFVGSSSADLPFTIENLGGATLTVSSVSITILSNYRIFQPVSNSIPAGSSTTFLAGNFNGAGGNATITINSNDSDEAVYTITALQCGC